MKARTPIDEERGHVSVAVKPSVHKDIKLYQVNHDIISMSHVMAMAMQALNRAEKGVKQI